LSHYEEAATSCSRASNLRNQVSRGRSSRRWDVKPQRVRSRWDRPDWVAVPAQQLPWRLNSRRRSCRRTWTGAPGGRRFVRHRVV